MPRDWQASCSPKTNTKPEKGHPMIAMRQTFIPAPGTDPHKVGVELVLCDEHGEPRRQHVWGLVRLLRRLC
tara:strand:+ start:641 stop:853 length:213 start_codon:yes stop_codon:yes gene_type:complete